MYVKSLHLEQVKGFPTLDFDFERPDGSFHGWTVLVGGNASGKSTVLKAIALALSGPDTGLQLLSLDTSGWIRLNQREARACLMLTRDEKQDRFNTRTRGQQPKSNFPAGIQWVTEVAGQNIRDISRPMLRMVEQPAAKSKQEKRAEQGPWNPTAQGWFCTGYGPMRRLSGSSSDAARLSSVGGTMSRFVTLFREDAALSDSEGWLKLNHSRQLESQDSARSAEIQTLLAGAQALLGDGLLPHGMQISRITVDHVYVKDSRGIELPMRDISDGCRSIYATVLDLIHGMAEVYGSENLFEQDADGRPIVNKPGVVLIDEIEAHLHPKWQSEIPEWLKVHFPQIQFIVTTHSPLVAQAADENGIFVLPAQDDLNREPRRLDPHEYEMIRLGKAEKTLLGTAFGLKNTRSKWANDRINQWKRLDAKRRSGARLTAQEKYQLETLQGQVQMSLEEAI
ncbi:MAG: AAA family ATPase [Leptothrix sp. (in: b-proteobacteria)]